MDRSLLGSLRLARCMAAEAGLSRDGSPTPIRGRVQGLVYDTGQVISDSVEVDRVFQPFGVTTAMYTPTSSPVTSAYDSVQLISRSMSYRWYFRIPTPMLTGSAARARKARSLAPRPGVSSFGGPRAPTARPASAMAAPHIRHLSWRPP